MHKQSNHDPFPSDRWASNRWGSGPSSRRLCSVKTSANSRFAAKLAASNRVPKDKTSLVRASKSLPADKFLLADSHDKQSARSRLLDR